jgi:hypothetical protein
MCLSTPLGLQYCSGRQHGRLAYLNNSLTAESEADFGFGMATAFVCARHRNSLNITNVI